MTLAKGLTNAVVPMGAVGVADFIYETLVEESEEAALSFSTAIPIRVIR